MNTDFSVKAENALETLKKDFEQEDPTYIACVKIIDSLNKAQHKTKYLSFNLLRKFSELSTEKNDIEILYRSISYLSGERVKLIFSNYGFIDQKQKFEHRLDNEELEDLHRHGIFYHPTTGEKVENPEEYIYMYFSIENLNI